ncbi:hypothetical protein [Polaromonas sp. YR568]|uniref:hypothetical protein n=1 Tax=Polaromonas sp. YR568 TaxID=1855301 RepID=UPI0015870ED5|nr:hypothetical protein [Polaromonas sp. YR568]
MNRGKIEAATNIGSQTLLNSVESRTSSGSNFYPILTHLGSTLLALKAGNLGVTSHAEYLALPKRVGQESMERSGQTSVQFNKQEFRVIASEKVS